MKCDNIEKQDDSIHQKTENVEEKERYMSDYLKRTSQGEEKEIKGFF